MKMLIVDDNSGYASPFPGYQASVIDLPFDFEVEQDPIGNILPKDQFTDEQREIINNLCDEKAKNPTFIVNELLPGWVEGGRERMKMFGTEDPNDHDDETLGICYLIQNLMTLAECAAVYNPIW